MIGDRLLSLADLACPILSVVGTVDEIAPARGVRAIRLAAPRADVHELALAAGHFGLVVGSTSNAVTWPTVAGWARWCDGEGEAPGADHPRFRTIRPARARAAGPQPGRLRARAAAGWGQRRRRARSVALAARRTARGMRELTIEAASQLPRLARLEQVQPSTRISLGLLVSERTRRAPDETFFLFEDRAYNAREVGERIDNIVRGLIWIGVRQGEHVGVLMGPRPSALAAGRRAQPARRRVGSPAPRRRLAREAALGQVHRVIADPERAVQAAALGTLHTFVLGGGGGPRDLGLELTNRHGADRSAQRPAAEVVPEQTRAARGRPRVRHLHRPRRGNPDEPDQRPAAGSRRPSGLHRRRRCRPPTPSTA